MVGTAATQPPNSAFGGGRGGVTQDNGPTQSDLNSYRVSAVIDRLYAHVQGIRKSEAVEFLNLCLSLTRGIDFAIANSEVPFRSKELPSLIKLVSQNRNDTPLQAAIMVLMISVKSACQRGWFSDKDSEDLNHLAKEIASTFGCVPDVNTVPSSSHPVISTILSRFFPKLRMGQVFAFLEVKPGFDAYVIDFQILKKLKHSPGEKLRLFVAQTDNVETSSCLISPAKANFLVNGRGVEKRTNLSMDTGPQIPTVITQLLKYGSNLLQAVGEFNGNYIVVVAFIREMPNSVASPMKDYEQHATAAVDSDSEITASRISLKCPISCKRIITPVKGHSCYHLQCFDFNNYVDINTKRPSWRCPSCNQPVCFTEIRIDQKMVKVLKEAGPNVSDIIISSDGSWKAVMESDDAAQKPEGDETIMGEDEFPEPSDVLDLTQIDDAMDATDTCRTEDTKTVDLFHLMSQNASFNTHVSNGFSSGISMPTNVQPNAQASPAAPSVLPAHLANLRQVSQASLPSLPQRHRSPQTPFPQTQHQQQTAGFQSPNPIQNAHRDNSSSQEMANLRPPRSMTQQSPGQVQSSVHRSHHVGSRSIHETRAPTSQQAHFVTTFNKAVQMQMSPNVTDVSPRTDTYVLNDVSWRPAARMRGALTGQAYDDALNQFIIQPSQQAQAARPVFNTTSLPAGIASQVQTYMFASGVAQNDYPAAGPGSGDSLGMP